MYEQINVFGKLNTSSVPGFSCALMEECSVTRLGEIRGVSTVCQAMISGVRVQSDTLDQMARFEENAIDAFRNKQFK